MRKSDLERSVNSASNGGAVTLEMVASEAGVSPSTVSRILNGTARVRESKVRAVEAAISKLRFTPNPVAVSLARGKSMTVGIVTQSFGSPFYGEALTAIEQRLMRANYAALFVSAHWREADERRCVGHLLNRRVEGIILLNSCLPEHELLNLARGAPLILTGRNVSGERIHCLDVDSTDGARLATKYLIDQGHRRIAFLAGPADHSDAVQRFEGYKAALALASRRRVAPGQPGNSSPRAIIPLAAASKELINWWRPEPSSRRCSRRTMRRPMARCSRFTDTALGFRSRCP